MTCWTFKPNDWLFNSPNCNNLIAGTILNRINIIGIAIRPMYMTSRVSAAAILRKVVSYLVHLIRFN